MWVLQHHPVHAFDMSTIIVFVYLGLQVIWNQFSSNNSHHTSCIHKGSHAGKWPDLMTSKPDSVSTLGYHWTDHTGWPLELQVHWDTTGTKRTDASTHWCSSGDPVLICMNGTHWKTTSGADNCKNRSNYDTSNIFGTYTLWGSLYKKKTRATQNFNTAAIFQDGRHGVSLNVNLCLQNGS